MINYFKTRIFLAGIMAEIKAQYADQKFFNSLISLAEVGDFLKNFRETPHYMNEGKRYYLASFDLLAQGIKSVEWPLEQRNIALMLQGRTSA